MEGEKKEESEKETEAEVKDEEQEEKEAQQAKTGAKEEEINGNTEMDSAMDFSIINAENSSLPSTFSDASASSSAQ